MPSYKMQFCHISVFFTLWSSLINIPPFSLGAKEKEEFCLRFKLTTSMTARQAMAYFCLLMVPEGTDDPPQYVLNCMEKQGIKHTDEDMQDFLIGKCT